MPKKRHKNPKPFNWHTARSSLMISLQEFCAELKPVNPYTPKSPVRRNSKTGEVRDASGRLLAIFGPQSWKALHDEMKARKPKL